MILLLMITLLCCADMLLNKALRPKAQPLNTSNIMHATYFLSYLTRLLNHFFAQLLLRLPRAMQRATGGVFFDDDRHNAYQYGMIR